MPEHVEHIASKKLYFGIFAILVVLTVVTYEVALINLGRLNVVVALGIAAVKSTLVALFFMHAYHSPKRTKLVIVCAVAWLALMIFGILGDNLTRGWLR
jgi:cytochrome c oxidase subunit IV